MRSSTEVFHDHLEKRLAGDTDADIKNNFAEDIVLLAATGEFRGQKGVRRSADELRTFLGDNAKFVYKHTLVSGRFALLEWTATSDSKRVCDGVDSFVIEEGKIVFQSIHYSITSNNSKKED